MKAVRILFAALSILLIAFGARSAETSAKIKVLVVSGGHGFEKEPFFKMFSDNPEIEFIPAMHSRTNATAYEREDFLDHDVVVLYDMMQQITDAQKGRLMALFDKGVGVVVLHHALGAYQHWPEYENVIGGRYQEPDPNKSGVVTEKVGWKENEEIPVLIAATNHPVTAGLKDFMIYDEIYWGFRVGKDSTPLITTTHPKSGKPLGWFKTQGKSRLVFIQPGHGKEAFENENYRKLLAQSIRWTARR